VSVVVLDNEAVQAAIDPQHAKHGRVIAHLESVITRRRRGADARVVVPCAVRVEAGWDRSAPTRASIKRFRVTDVILDGRQGDLAADIVNREQVSVADAHVGAAVTVNGWGGAVILTSDPNDMRRVCAPLSVTAIRI
jgi:predicted nucleic acid-binding protein